MRVANWNKTGNLLNLQLSTFIFNDYKIRVRHRERDRESLKFPSGGHICDAIREKGPTIHLT